jgi:hypothetical protein
MKTSRFYTPPNHYYIQRYEWQVKALNQNVCACEILSILMLHLDYSSMNDLMNRLIDSAIKKNGKLIDTSDWLPYSNMYLRELLLASYSSKTIINAINLLVEKSFISDKPPTKITDFYSSRMNWYKVNVNAINKWVSEHYPVVYADIEITPTIKPKVEKIKEVGLAEQLGKYYKHIFNRTERYLLDADRLRGLNAQIKLKRPIAELALAVIGMTVADEFWEEKGFNDLFYIFRNSKNCDRFQQYANDNKITNNDAENDFNAFLQGNDSQYKQLDKKAMTTPVNNQFTHIPQEVKMQYREFSRMVYNFFDNSTTEEVNELCRKTESYKPYLKLINADLLSFTIVKAYETAKGRLPEADTKKTIEEFSILFCRENQRKK